MRKLYFTMLMSFSIIVSLKAQDNVGIGTLNPNNFAILELVSNNQGLLIPRLSTAQRTAISGLGIGESSLLVYDTDFGTFFYWDGAQWIAFPLDNDPNNELQNLTLQNDSLRISNGNSIDLSAYLIDLDEQTLSLVNDTLYIENANSVYLPDLVDDADADPSNELQNLTLQNDSLTISNGNSIDLSAYLIDLDEQTLSLVNDTLYIENANSVYLPDLVDDADADPSNELQNLTLQNDSLLLSNGTGVDLSGYAGGTDDQNLTGASLNASNILTIAIENGSSTSVDLSALAGGSTNIDHDWYELGTTTPPNAITDNIYTEGKVNIGLNADNRYSLNVYRNIQVGNVFNNLGNPTSFGILAGDSNNISYNDVGITVGNHNTVQGESRYVLGDYNRNVSSAGFYGMIMGEYDTLISSGYDNIGFNLGKSNYLQTSGGGNTMAVFGRGNRIVASGNDRYIKIEGLYNSTIHSGVDNYGFVNGSNNTFNLNGVGNAGFVMGKDNVVLYPDELFVFGFRDSCANGNKGYILGNDIVIRRFSDYNVAIGADLTIDESDDRNILIGRKAFTTNDGVMMLTDGYTGPTILNSIADNSLTTRFAGGYRFFSNHALTAGVSLAAGGGAWASISDINKKENFQDLDKEYILKSIANFKIYNWNYISQEDNIRHIGPFAQDFYEAFQLGTSNTSIVTSDISGINMVAIQALYDRNVALEEEVVLLKAQQAAYLERLEALEELLQNK